MHKSVIIMNKNIAEVYVIQRHDLPIIWRGSLADKQQNRIYPYFLMTDAPDVHLQVPHKVL